MGKLVSWNKEHLRIGDIPVAIISLTDAKNRREKLVERGFAPELVNGFWPACDMRGLPDSALKPYRQYSDIKRLYGRPPVSAELGCFFSHSSIVEWLSEQTTVSHVVVFEDDVVPVTTSSFEKLSQLATSISQFASSDEPCIFHLGPRTEQWASALTRRISKDDFQVPGIELFDFVDRKVGLWRAHAYIINKAAAISYKSIVRETGFLADDWHTIADKTMSRIIVVTPPLFTQDEDVSSTIDPGNKRTLMNGEVASLIKSGARDGLRTGHAFQRGWRLCKRLGKILLVKLYRALPSKNLY